MSSGGWGGLVKNLLPCPIRESKPRHPRFKASVIPTRHTMLQWSYTAKNHLSGTNLIYLSTYILKVTKINSQLYYYVLQAKTLTIFWVWHLTETALIHHPFREWLIYKLEKLKLGPLLKIAVFLKKIPVFFIDFKKKNSSFSCNRQ